MSAVSVRQPFLDGHRAVAGLWLPADWFDVPTRQRLILASWRAGASACRFPLGDLLRWPEAAMQDCASLPGWPLQRVAGALCSAAVAPAELEGRPGADLWLALGAELVGLRIADGQVLDPSRWLPVDDIAFVDSWDLRPPPVERVFVGVQPARDIREILGEGLPPASADSHSFLAALADRSKNLTAGQAAGRPPSSRHAGSGAGAGSSVGALLFALVMVSSVARCMTDQASSGGPSSWMPPPATTSSPATAPANHTPLTSTPTAAGHAPPSGAGASARNENPADPMKKAIALLVVFTGALMLFLWLRRFFRGHGAAVPGASASGGSAGSTGSSANGGVGSPSGSKPGLRERLRDRVVPQRWRAWLARMAMTGGVARVLGRQHAAYLRRMLALFDEGRLDEALRHAVPLGQEQESLGQLLGRLAPRQDLSLGSRRGGATTVSVNDALERHLRALYRASFERLDREGRIDEAVFVLAELLRVRPEALDYLEKHARHAQAAELALSWDMPAAQIIRLLALAGDWQRALQVARRDNAFEAAVTLLQSRSPDMAARLRREWASSLVAQGRWLAAVEAIWPLADERAAAAEWLDLAEAAGEATGARALALRAQCLPDTLAARSGRLHALRDDPALAHERAALARQLLALEAPVSLAARRLAATIAGALMADHDGGQGALDAATLRRVAEFADDPFLMADMPAGGMPERQTRSLTARDVAARWPAPDAGLLPILDAVPLADAELLVALGEPGLLRLDAQGRRIGRLDVPAHRLVIAHDGRSALALAQRGESWRVSRLDLVRMSAHDLGHVSLQAFADQYDGLGWTVAEGARVQVLDTSRDQLSDVIWQVTELPGRVVQIDATPNSESWLLDAGEGRLETWTYQLPRRTLRHREPVADAASATRVLVVAGAGAMSLTQDPFRPAVSQWRSSPERPGQWPSCPTPAPGHPARATPQWIALRQLREQADGTPVAAPSIDFAWLQTGRVQAGVDWPVDALVQIRAFATCWLLHDAQGRLAVLWLETGRLETVSVR